MSTKQNLGYTLNQLLDLEEEIKAEKDSLIYKAMGSDQPNDILLANKLVREKTAGQKSFILDPLNNQEFNGYRSRPTEIGFSYLRSMANSTPIISSIIVTRKEQVASYSSYSNDDLRPGWKIEKNIDNYFGDDEEMSNLKKIDRTERDEVRKVISFIENCGVKNRLYHGDDIETFLRKYTGDSLILDQATFEIIPTKIYKPYEFFCTDGSTYRFASPSTMDEIGKQRGYYPYAVQIYQGTIYNAFYPWELCIGIRNPTTNIKNNGYGISELELLIKVVTYILYSESYNGKFFSQGSNPKGMFVAEGNFSEDKISEFRQTWRAQVAGVENAWKVPFLAGGKIQWIDMQKSNTDMEFYKWTEYLIRLACAIFKIDSRELGFNLDSGDGGVNYEASIQNKLTYSKEKGLIPLLNSIEKKINRYIVFPLTNNKYRFKFTGVDDVEQMIVKLDIEKLKEGAITWKEFRSKYGMPEVIDRDDFLLNSTYVQIATILSQRDQEVDNKNSFEFEYDGTNNDKQDTMNVFKKFNEGNPFMDDLENFTKSVIENEK